MKGIECKQFKMIVYDKTQDDITKSFIFSLSSNNKIDICEDYG